MMVELYLYISSDANIRTFPSPGRTALPSVATYKSECYDYAAEILMALREHQWLHVASRSYAPEAGAVVLTRQRHCWQP